MSRTLIAVVIFCLCSAVAWGNSLRFFASWNDVCFQDGPGWDIGLVELLGQVRWTSDRFLSSVAPFLPFLLFAGPKQSRTRQIAMIGAMLSMVSAVWLLSGPANAADCDTKGPFPEIGHLLLGVMVSLPLALILAWLTRLRSA